MRRRKSKKTVQTPYSGLLRLLPQPAAACDNKPADPMRAEEVMLLFGPGRMWVLSPEKAGFIENLFQQKGNILIRSGSSWFSAAEWGTRKSTDIRSSGRYWRENFQHS